MNTMVYDGNIARFGNSQGVRIPISILQEANLYEDLSTIGGAKIPIKLEVTNGSITIRRAKKEIPTPTLEEILANWNGEPYDRYDWGDLETPQGRELV